MKRTHCKRPMWFKCIGFLTKVATTPMSFYNMKRSSVPALNTEFGRCFCCFSSRGLLPLPGEQGAQTGKALSEAPSRE